MNKIIPKINIRRGFTLTEVAIVIVIVGIVMGITIKGRALLDSARWTSDLNKINKITSSAVIWQNIQFPDPKKPSTYANAVDDMLQLDIITSDDLKLYNYSFADESYINTPAYYPVRISGCYLKDSGHTMSAHSPASKCDRICVEFQNHINDTDMTGDSLRNICQLERDMGNNDFETEPGVVSDGTNTSIYDVKFNTCMRQNQSAQSGQFWSNFI